MCKYCEEGSKLSRGEIQSQIIKDGDNHYIESIMFDSSIEDYTTDKVRIFFCPMCGQDLLALDQRVIDTILLSRLGCECHDVVGRLAENVENELLEILLEVSNYKLNKVKEVIGNIPCTDNHTKLVEEVSNGITTIATK